MPNLVWRVKLVAELRPGVITETEVARIERDEQAGLADLGLRLAETKRLTAALQAEIVPAQVAAVGEQRRCCSSCGRRLASKATANNERVGWIATRCKPGGADSGMSRCGLSSPYGRWIIDSRTVYGG